MKHLAHSVLSFSLLFGVIFVAPANAQQDKHQEQAQRSHYGSMPHRGMTMVEVKQRFGQPLNMLV